MGRHESVEVAIPAATAGQHSLLIRGQLDRPDTTALGSHDDESEDSSQWSLMATVLRCVIEVLRKLYPGIPVSVFVAVPSSPRTSTGESDTSAIVSSD